MAQPSSEIQSSQGLWTQVPGLRLGLGNLILGTAIRARRGMRKTFGVVDPPDSPGDTVAEIVVDLGGTIQSEI